MTRIKKLLLSGAIIYALVFGIVVALVATNDFVLSFLSRAVEMEFNPFDLNEWLLIIMEA